MVTRQSYGDIFSTEVSLFSLTPDRLYLIKNRERTKGRKREERMKEGKKKERNEGRKKGRKKEKRKRGRKILNQLLLVWFILISALLLITSCCLFILGVFTYFCSRYFRCAVKLLVYALSSFFLEVLRVVTFPHSTSFIVSHKFGYVVPSFSLNSKKSLISFFSFDQVIIEKGIVHVPCVCGLSIVLLLLKTSLSLW